MNVDAVLIGEIEKEWQRQDAAKAAGKFRYTCDELSNDDNLAVLGEEYGEYARALTPNEARAELLQIAACALRALQRPRGANPPIRAHTPVIIRLKLAAEELEAEARDALGTFD